MENQSKSVLNRGAHLTGEATQPDVMAWGGVKFTNSAQSGCSTSLGWEWKLSRKDRWLFIRPEKGRESKVIPGLLWKSVDHDINQQVGLLNDRFLSCIFFLLVCFLKLCLTGWYSDFFKPKTSCYLDSLWSSSESLLYSSSLNFYTCWQKSSE